MPKFKEIREATQYNPYAIGMAVAKKKAGYGPGPVHDLPKKVITKGHEIAKKIKANEDFDIDEILAEITTPMQKLRDALDRHTEHALAANKRGDDEAVKVHQGYMNKIKNKMAKMARNEDIDLEELESLCEISKQTLGSYIKRSSHDAALSARHGGSDPKELKNAIKRLKGIAKATNRLTNEESEQIDELSNKTLGSYAKSAAAQTLGLSAALGAMKTVDSAVEAQRKLRNRYQGTQKAITKMMAKEDVEPIDEISKATLASYIPQAAKSARFSGMTSQDMQNRSRRAKSQDMKDSFARLSAKYRSKAWKREDNIEKAAKKLAKE